jgi:hypothetical protein
VQRQIIEPLVNSYGPFRVRQLVLQVDDRKPLTLEVCELTLADGQGQEIPLKIVHNSRTDLSWIVYAIEVYLGDLDYMRIEFDRGKDWRQDNGLEEIDNIQQWGDDVTDMQWAAMIARQHILTHPRQRELMDVYYEQVSEALQALRASHPEGIPDLLEGVRGKEAARPQLWELPRFLQEKSQGMPKPWHIIRLDRSFSFRDVGVGPKSHITWRIEPELPPVSTPILGEMVLQAGPFQVFEDFGNYALKTIHLTPLRQKEDGTWVNPTYRIFYQDEAQQNEALLGDGPRRRDLGSLTSLDTPTAAQICRAIKRVLTNIWSSAPEDYDKIYEMQLLELLEAGRYDAEDKPIYDAWVALGCLNAPTDDSAPTFDPSTAEDFDMDEW